MADIIDEIEQRESASAGVSLQRAVVTAPDRAAMAQSYAKELGLPPEAIASDFDESQREVQVRRAVSALQGAPATQAWIADPENAAVAHDSVKGLTDIEKLVKSGYPVLREPQLPKPTIGSYVRGQITNARTGGSKLKQGIRMFIGDLLGWDDISADAKREYGDAQFREDLVHPAFQSKTADAVYGGVSSTIQTVPTVALTLAAPPVGLTAMGAQTGFQSYGKYRERGGTPAEAAVGGTLEGVTESATEMIPMGYFVKRFGKTGFKSFLGGFLAREVPSEQLATLVQDAVDTAIANPDKTWGQYLSERPDAAYNTLVATAVTSLMFGSAEGVAHMQSKKAHAAQAAGHLDQTIAAVHENPVMQRSPERMQALLNDLVGDEKVYVPAEKVAEYFQDRDPAEVERTLYDWGIHDQMGEALAAGTDVVFDKAPYITKVGGTDAHAFWRDDLRDGLGAVSTREAEHLGSLDDLLEAAAREAYDATTKEEGAAAPAQKVYDDVFSKLREAGYTLDAARPQASLMAEYYATRAQRSPDQYADAWQAYQATPVSVRVALPESVKQVYDKTDQLLNALRRRVDSRTQGELRGDSLLEFVSKQGGVTGADGEMEAADLHKWHTERPFRRKIVRADADVNYGMERVAERAHDAGYISDATPEALMAAMREERAGRPRFSDRVQVDQSAAEFDQALNDLEELMSRLGVDPSTVSNPEIKDLLSQWAKEPEGASYEQVAQRRFAGDLDAMMRGRLGSRELLHLGRTPGPYRALGAADLPLVMAQSVARKIMAGGKHGLPRSTVERLPGLLADPVMIFASATEEGSLVAVLRDYDPDGNPLVAALHLGDGRIRVNSVKSVYGKDRADWFAAQIKDGRLRYIDAESAPRWSGGIGLQLPEWGPSAGRKGKVVTKADLVNRGAFEQGGGEGPQGSITFSRAGAVITLFRSRDLSTFLHEGGHLWVENLIDDASAESAPQQVRDDLQTVLDWMGAGVKVSEGATAIRSAVTTDMHERWARATEAYLMEGKAPSVALRGSFERFKAWLVSIYKAVASLRTPINDDIRGVLDRLIATDEEIATARRAQAMEALFSTPEEMGATPQVFAAYQETVQRAKTEAHDRLLAKVMSAIKRKRQAEWREEADALRPEIEKRVDVEPDMAALQFLRGSPAKLSADAVAEVMGSPSFLADLPRAVPPIYSETGGLHPDEAAEMLGFRTGQAMLQALAGIEADRRAMVENGDKRSVRRARIEAELQREMLERHGDVLADGSIQEEAVAALHGEKQGAVIAEELRALSSRARIAPTPLQAMKAFAERTIANKRERDLQPGLYLRAERKAANAAMEALAVADHVEAFRQKQQQLLNFQLYLAARTAREDIDKAVRTFTRYSGAKTLQGMAQDYLEQIHGLLERFSFRTATLKELDQRKSFEAWAQTKLAEGESVVVPERFLRDRFQKSWREMTVDEMRGLYDSVRNVAHLGRMKQDILDGQARRAFEAVVQEAYDQAMALPSRKPNLRVGKAKGARALGEGILQADASLLKVETLADFLDGGNPAGVFNRLLVRRAVEAENERGKLRQEFMRPVVEAYSAIPGEIKRRWNSKVASGLLDPITGEPFDLRRGDLLGMAVHVGNTSNMEKLTRGYDWDPRAVMDILNRELTKPEWDFVQANWDALEALRPHIARVERALSGVEPEWIDPSPVVTAHGTYKGGYFPVSYDPLRDANADKHEKQDADFFGGVYFSAATPKGHTITRTDYHGPVLIDLNASVLSHVNKAITRVAYGEYVRDARKFIGNGRIRQLVQTKLGDEYYQQFMPWLQRQVNDQILSDRALSFMNRFARRARINWQITVMGLSLTTGLSQTAGLTASAGVIGAKWTGHGIIKAVQLAKQGKLGEYVFDRSEEMRQRNVDLDRDLRDALRDLAGKPDPLNRVRAAAMVHIGWIDRYTVAVPTWIGAFDKALREGEEESEAIARADKAVRQSQGSGRPYDLAAVQAPNNEWMKLFTLAYSYFNVQYNRQREAGRAAKLGDFNRAFTLSFWFLIASPLASALVSGDWPDAEDEDGELAAWMKWFGRKTFFGFFAGVPVARDAAAVLDRKLAGQYASFGGTPISRAGEGVLKVGNDIAAALDPDKEPSDRWLQHAIETPGYFLGLPTLQIGRSTQYLWDVLDGDQDPKNAVDLVKGAIKGPQEDQKAGHS